MEPTTQSAQISSSQGFADGQNSAAKDSKLCDSFLSSSPVSLIQSPQEKRIVLGSEKPCEGVATSLRFPSQPGSFTSGQYGSEATPAEGQPDSPIKTSPVSERIKALEALAAKKETNFRSDGGFSHFRDRHYEKSAAEAQKCQAETKTPPTENQKPPTDTQKHPAETQKFATEKTLPTAPQKGGSVDQESPESPFEVLGDFRQVREIEETEEWMKAYLPPVPDFDAVYFIKGSLTSDNVTSKEEKVTDIAIADAPAAFASVPDAFMDFPINVSEFKDNCNEPKQQSVEEETEFDTSFLPTAYVWDQQEKSGVQLQANPDSKVPASPTPLVGFESPSPAVTPIVDISAKKNASDDKTISWTGDPEHREASEIDSSGESEDTVIEDGAIIPASVPTAASDPAFSNDPTTAPVSVAPNVPTEDKVILPPKSERKLMQVPTINVIETDEPNYSEEEMEMELEVKEEDEFEVDTVDEAPKTTEQEDTENDQPKTRPLETEFMEGYSPPSSPVDSDDEYMPKHKMLKSLSETYDQESTCDPEAQPSPSVLKELASDFSPGQSRKTQTLPGNVKDESPTFKIPNEEVDFPDNDDEWSDEAQDMLVKSCRADLPSKEPLPCTLSTTIESGNTAVETYLSKTSFIQDDIYDRQSFDYDYDASSLLDEQLPPDSSEIQIETLNSSVSQKDVPDHSRNLNTATLQNDSEVPGGINEQEINKSLTDYISDNTGNDNSLTAQQPQNEGDVLEPDVATQPEIANSNRVVSEPADSFVEFMRECLKSRLEEEPDTQRHSDLPESKVCETGLSVSQSPSNVVMDLEQENLTIRALKELGSSQEEDEVTSFQSKVPDQNEANPNAAAIEKSSVLSLPTTPCSQSDPAFNSMYSKEMEAIDEWVAEAYHLAEHVLTVILTHLSVKDLIHWRDPKKSGVVFGVSMLILLSLAAFSIISVVSYLLLALLCVTITFRIYKSVVQAVQKSSDGHPFKTLIDKDVSIPPETFRKHVDSSLTYINQALKQMSRLFLVEDLVDSLKLAVVMWLLTYVGAVFNGITILILADILLFTIPPVYEKNKTQIDQYIDLARTQVNTTIAKLQEKLPGALKRSKTE